MPVIVIGAIVYLAIAGMVFVRVYRDQQARCRSCQRDPDLCMSLHGGVAFGLAVSWPVAMWAVLPALWTDPKKAERIAEAQRAKIAALEAENIELERKLSRG